MTRKHWIVGVLIFASVGAVCLGALYTWTGGGQDDNWDTSANWSTYGQRPYPSTTSDDAVFPYDQNGWAVNLTTEQIDDLSISADTEFQAGGGGGGGWVTLTADTVTISGTSPAGGHEVVVTLFENARITTVPTP
ncbi:MAG TPA: hypothetical protein PKK06_04990 [Phycisphaerae bacterium]|nr:hypothetical protein [Phycisphaerae bacterium]HNU45196.1 hypothetical protein [Phycisphaerae bacterium]